MRGLNLKHTIFLILALSLLFNAHTFLNKKGVSLRQPFIRSIAAYKKAQRESFRSHPSLPQANRISKGQNTPAPSVIQLLGSNNIALVHFIALSVFLADSCRILFDRCKSLIFFPAHWFS
ncbi:hypothetical protein [Pararcticibacter amylolyticus]|uniref:Uncharacterized protein n=1 Tax=Pararcticibacter amylolyticus TaxID=2173175 RepID=A0A2U2PHJ4_9SPHI|nr:hypothetical protein [Pararcticibacter amylolyticus]PWG80876.1 hypothetical protein DDR33_10530 [Pararcticibacter amylolyticus]